jgi:hypothetical protein
MLDSDPKKCYNNFPLKEALQPTDPDRFEQWHDNAFKDINEESQDPDGQPPYPLENDEGDAWQEMYDTMRKVLGAPRGPEVRNYTLKSLKETCIFVDHIPG